MALTDPELDLLREMLEDDPASPVFLQVGEELVRRGRWSDAVDVLAAGLARAEDDGPAVGYALLARAALECGAHTVALEALSALEIDPESQPELSRIEILALERSGRLEEARERAERFLAHDSRDVVVSTVLERLAAPPPPRHRRATDPFYTVARAEAYVDVGRTDRALRVYRRILQANRADPSLELRLRQLLTTPQRVPDDLSVELTDPGLVPEEPDLADTPAPTPLAMPPPRRSPGETPGPTSSEDDPELTATPVARDRVLGRPLRSEFPASDDDEEQTEQLDVRAALRRYARGGGLRDTPLRETPRETPVRDGPPPAGGAPATRQPPAAEPPRRAPPVRRTPASGPPPIDRRLQAPPPLGARYLPEPDPSALDDLEDDLPTVKARLTPSSPGSSPGLGEAPTAPEVAPPEPLAPTEPPAATRAKEPEPASAPAHREPDDPERAPPDASPPPPKADLDLLTGTETEWTTGEDRPSRRLLRR